MVQDWHCKLCDFGLARTKESFYLSLGCGGVGTPEWTAPEVLKGEAFNEQADVYSFGVILCAPPKDVMRHHSQLTTRCRGRWEMCTRRKPWKGLMQVQVVVAVGMKGERLPKVPGLQPHFGRSVAVQLLTGWRRPKPSDRQILDAVGGPEYIALHEVPTRHHALGMRRRRWRHLLIMNGAGRRNAWRTRCTSGRRCRRWRTGC